jgi:hypothetical protein
MQNFDQALNGLETELRFKDFINNHGFNAIKVGPAYDIHHHFDINISANIEIKGMKALRRGEETQDEWHWLEIRGVRDEGWIYGSHADIIAFETKKSWILVRPTSLIDYVQRFVEHTFVDKPILAQYKLYQRHNRDDAITLVSTDDLRRIGLEWSK